MDTEEETSPKKKEEKEVECRIRTIILFNSGSTQNTLQEMKILTLL